MQNINWLELKSGTDIRGFAIETEGCKIQLTDTVVEQIAKAFYVFLLQKLKKDSIHIAVGVDSRLSANRLANAVLKGLQSSGANVYYTGLSSTPAMFMILQDKNYTIDASIMITASHMPYHYNGLKFFLKTGGLSGKEITTILQLAQAGKFCIGNGQYSELNYMDSYAEHLVKFVQNKTGEKQPLRGKKVIVDAGNGAGGFYAKKVLLPLGANIEGSQFLEPDGNFPNHMPDPENKQAIASLRSAVLANKADFGIIFDTDVDRAGAVDENGKLINKNRLIALLAAILLREQSGATIVTDSLTSDGLPKFIAKLGGRHRRFKRGYKNVIDEAVRLNQEGVYAPLAIETSGHAALKENYFLDDGAYVVTRLLIQLVEYAKENRSLLSLIDSLEEAVEDGGCNLAFKENGDISTMCQHFFTYITTHLSDTEGVTLAAENYEDGVRLQFDEKHGNGWVVCRQSLHEPLVVFNYESSTHGGGKIIVNFLIHLLASYEKIDCTPLKKFL